MKYYFDTEFVEGIQKSNSFLSFLKKDKPTIDLISIGIVAEDGREYYAISKDFNLKEAWNRVMVTTHSDEKPSYWIRENVLKPIWKELSNIYFFSCFDNSINLDSGMTYKNFKLLLNKYGKSNKQISKEIFSFVNPDLGFPVEGYNNSELKEGGRLYEHFNVHDVVVIKGCYYARPKFYGYYSSYDWVVFCWLFGVMMELPEGFPYLPIDLVQKSKLLQLFNSNNYPYEQSTNFPLQKEGTLHNALEDARWCREFDKFLDSFIENKIKEKEYER